MHLIKSETLVLAADAFDRLLRRINQAGGYDPKVARVLTNPSPWDEDLCPNCITPWKCNGPHIPDGPWRKAPRLYNRLVKRPWIRRLLG